MFVGVALKKADVCELELSISDIKRRLVSDDYLPVSRSYWNGSLEPFVITRSFSLGIPMHLSRLSDLKVLKCQIYDHDFWEMNRDSSPEFMCW